MLALDMIACIDDEKEKGGASQCKMTAKNEQIKNKKLKGMKI